MALDVEIVGLTGTQADVDANNNLHVVLPKTATAAGVALMWTENDPGTATGTPNVNSPITTEDDRMLVGIDTAFFDYHFNALAQDTGVWSCTFTTMTITQAGGFALFNSNSTATTTTGCALRTWRTFSLFGAAALRAVFSGQVTAAPLANQVVELGLFTPNTTSAPSDGVYFRISSAGIFGILNYNGTETSTAAFNTTGAFGWSTIPASTNQVFAVNIGEFGAEFWMNGVLMATLPLPAADSQGFLTSSLPLAMQQRNGGTVSGSPQLQFKIGACHVTMREIANNMPLPHAQAAMGQMGYQGLSGGTMGSSANYTNSEAAGAGAAMTNTTALVTGLGGQAAIQPTLAAGTDGIAVSWQNPVATVNQTPRTFVCTGVRVHGAVTTVLAGGPVLYAYSVAFGHTAVSLATAESASFANATAKAPRRVPIGYETFAATAAAGTVGSPGGIDMDFSEAPIIVNPGEFLALVAKNQGTVTTSGVITLLVTFRGYFI